MGQLALWLECQTLDQEGGHEFSQGQNLAICLKVEDLGLGLLQNNEKIIALGNIYFRLCVYVFNADINICYLSNKAWQGKLYM